MDGENNGSKPYFLMDDLGGNTPIFGSTPILLKCGHWTQWFESLEVLKKGSDLLAMFFWVNGSGQVIATSHDLGPQKVAKERKSLYFRKIQVGEIL